MFVPHNLVADTPCRVGVKVASPGTVCPVMGLVWISLHLVRIPAVLIAVTQYSGVQDIPVLV